MHWKTEKYIKELLVGLVEKQVRTRDLSAENLQEDLADSGVVVEGSNCALTPAKRASQKPALHPHQNTVHINTHLTKCALIGAFHCTCPLLGGNQ